MAIPPLLSRQNTTESNWTKPKHFGGIDPARLSSILDQADHGWQRDYQDLIDYIIETDLHTFAVYESLLSGIASAPWDVAPGPTLRGGVDANGQLAADLCAGALRKMRGWQETVKSLLDAIGRGYAVGEIDWAMSEGAWLPRRVEWVHSRRFVAGVDGEVRLQTADSYDGELLTPDRFIVHAPMTRPAHLPRRGLMRGVTWTWLFKRWTMKYYVSAAERMGTPIPLGTVPGEASEQVKADLLGALKNLSSHQALVAEVGTSVEFLDTKIGQCAPTFESLIQLCNSEISKGFLGNTLTTELQDVGANAAAKSQYAAGQLPRVKSYAKSLAETIEDQLFGPILRFNRHMTGGVDVAIPELKFTLEDLQATAIPPHVLQASAVTIDELRASVDLPPLGKERGGDAIATAVPTYGGLGAGLTDTQGMTPEISGGSVASPLGPSGTTATRGLTSRSTTPTTLRLTAQVEDVLLGRSEGPSISSKGE